jgi:glycine/D-amino acid oxidase-like deaminating enzyme
LAEHASLEETTEKHIDRAFGLNVRAMVFTVQHPVVIIGAGVAGLTLATFLHGSGVNCVVLERGDRAYLQTVRQRAGVVDARNVQMFERPGFAEKLLPGPLLRRSTIELMATAVSSKLLGTTPAMAGFAPSRCWSTTASRIDRRDGRRRTVRSRRGHDS